MENNHCLTHEHWKLYAIGYRNCLMPSVCQVITKNNIENEIMAYMELQMFMS